jgi:hypothetical protein
MRRFALLALLGLSVLPGVALAQDASNLPQSGPGSSGDQSGHHWQHDGWRHGPNGGEFLEKFYAANTTHDGHLTLAQAKAADLKMVVEHFSQIDSKNRGYVTFYDIQAWHLDRMAQRLEHKAEQLRAQD